MVCVYITLEKLETKFTLLVTKKSESIVDVVIVCDSKLLLAAADAVTLAKRPFLTEINFAYQAYPAFMETQKIILFQKRKNTSTDRQLNTYLDVTCLSVFGIQVFPPASQIMGTELDRD